MALLASRLVLSNILGKIGFSFILSFYGLILSFPKIWLFFTFQVSFPSGVTIQVWSTIQLYQFLIVTFSLFEFGYNLGIVTKWVLSPFEFLYYLCFVTVWVLSQFELCYNLSCVTIWVALQFNMRYNLSFVLIWVLSFMEFCHKKSFVTM